MSPRDFAAAKEELRARLRRLTDELDLFLAGECGIDLKKKDGKNASTKWYKSHQPFHWFAEFYGILKAGGFNAIIGNPPYVVYTPEKVSYTIPPESFRTFNAKNLYAYFYERSLALGNRLSHVGLIVQMTVLSAERQDSLQDILMNRGLLCAVSFPRRPESVFEGVEMPVAILLSSHRSPPTVFTSRVCRFYTKERNDALATVCLTPHSIRRGSHRIAKIGTGTEDIIYRKITGESLSVGDLAKKDSRWLLYYQEACRYWTKAGMGMPFFRRNGEKMDPPHGRTVCFVSKEAACFTACLLNSSLFYWFYSVFSDCEHINDSLLHEFPVSRHWQNSPWAGLYEQLEADLAAHAKRKVITTKEGHTIEYDEMKALLSKPVIDEIDDALGKHYGFTDEELDFIINYDIKYRMGDEIGGEDDE
jgi:hypothetical protein